MNKNMCGLAVVCLLFAQCGLSHALYSAEQFEESDLTGECNINDTPCGASAKTGAVIQIFTGEDVHVYAKDKVYYADHYKVTFVFRQAAKLKTESFKNLEELNTSLAQQGFRTVSVQEINSPNSLNNAYTGTVLQKLGGLDIYAFKRDGGYLAVHYKVSRFLSEKDKVNEYRFKTLKELNEHVLRTTRELQEQDSSKF